MTVANFRIPRARFAQVGRIPAVFPNLRKIGTCASWEKRGTFLRKLGRDIGNSRVAHALPFWQELRKLGKSRENCPSSLRKLGNSAAIRAIAGPGRSNARSTDVGNSFATFDGDRDFLRQLN